MMPITQRDLSRKVMTKIGVLALPNRIEKIFSIFNSSTEDPLSMRIKTQVLKKQDEVKQK
jgi:hypothetical protein